MAQRSEPTLRAGVSEALAQLLRASRDVPTGRAIPSCHHESARYHKAVGGRWRWRSVLSSNMGPQSTFKSADAGLKLPQHALQTLVGQRKSIVFSPSGHPSPAVPVWSCWFAGATMPSEDSDKWWLRWSVSVVHLPSSGLEHQHNPPRRFVGSWPGQPCSTSKTQALGKLLAMHQLMLPPLANQRCPSMSATRWPDPFSLIVPRPLP